MRFYPEIIAPYWMEPLPAEFAIRETASAGKGLFAKRRFPKGERLFVFSGILGTNITQHSLRVSTGNHLHDEWVMGYSLHSCDPNCTVDMKERTFTATRDIQEGDAVTMNYNETEEVLFRPFVCRCGSCDQTTIKGWGVHDVWDEAKVYRNLIEHNWRFAKSLSHIPHFYSRKTDWDNVNDFAWCCDYIQKNSSKGRFAETGTYEFNYCYLGKWKYWVMERDKSADQQVVINKALNENFSQ